MLAHIRQKQAEYQPGEPFDLVGKGKKSTFLGSATAQEEIVENYS